MPAMTSAPSPSAISKSNVVTRFRAFKFKLEVREAIHKSRLATSRFFERLWFGAEDEEKKVVVRKSLWGALLRCSIHLIAMFATITIAYMNLAGYFIGAELQGLTGDVIQALDVLCLQVSAKLLVIDSIFVV